MVELDPLSADYAGDLLLLVLYPVSPLLLLQDPLDQLLLVEKVEVLASFVVFLLVLFLEEGDLLLLVHVFLEGLFYLTYQLSPLLVFLKQVAHLLPLVVAQLLLVYLNLL